MNSRSTAHLLRFLPLLVFPSFFSIESRSESCLSRKDLFVFARDCLLWLIIMNGLDFNFSLFVVLACSFSRLALGLPNFSRPSRPAYTVANRDSLSCRIFLTTFSILDKLTNSDFWSLLVAVVTSRFRFKDLFWLVPPSCWDKLRWWMRLKSSSVKILVWLINSAFSLTSWIKSSSSIEINEYRSIRVLLISNRACYRQGF